MKKIRGKNFTVGQKKVLMRNGISMKELDQYLFQGMRFIEDGNKNLTRSKDKREQWTLINRNNGESREVAINA